MKIPTLDVTSQTYTTIYNLNSQKKKKSQNIHYNTMSKLTTKPVS